MTYALKTATVTLILIALAVAGCGQPAGHEQAQPVAGDFQQAPGDLLSEQVVAIAYSGFRAGQHPDRGEGAINPSMDEILEDLQILVDHGFRLLRLYDTGENSVNTLQLIRDHDLPIEVLLGIWLDAEVSNHEGCPWLDEPIPAPKLAANIEVNQAAVERGIELATEYADIVVAVNVGNEALVSWNDHMVPLDRVIAYVREVREAIEQPVLSPTTTNGGHRMERHSPRRSTSWAYTLTRSGNTRLSTRRLPTPWRISSAFIRHCPKSPS